VSEGLISSLNTHEGSSKSMTLFTYGTYSLIIRHHHCIQ